LYTPRTIKVVLRRRGRQRGDEMSDGMDDEETPRCTARRYREEVKVGKVRRNSLMF
jgi:hypothetical protein